MLLSTTEPQYQIFCAQRRVSSCCEKQRQPLLLRSGESNHIKASYNGFQKELEILGQQAKFSSCRSSVQPWRGCPNTPAQAHPWLPLEAEQRGYLQFNLKMMAARTWCSPARAQTVFEKISKTSTPFSPSYYLDLHFHTAHSLKYWVKKLQKMRCCFILSQDWVV